MRKLIQAALVAVLVTALLSSCGPKLVSSNTTTTIKKEWRDTLVTAIVVRPEFKIKKDTTINKLAPCVDEPIVIEKKDAKGNSLKVVIDSLGRITAECISKEDSLKTEIKLRIEKETILKETVKVYEEREKWWKALVRKVSIGILAILTIAVLILYILKKVKSTISPF
jgi:hypothetical protein